MAKSKRQDTVIGNIVGKAPILANAKPNTAGELKQSQASIGHAPKDTKPVSVAEALSLWQTSCSDLQAYGFQTAILARNNRVILLLAPPASIGEVTVKDGHLYIDGLPVSDL